MFDESRSDGACPVVGHYPSVPDGDIKKVELMKIVCASDTHGLHREIDIPHGDILIHAGDLTAYGKENELHEVNAWLEAMPHKHKVVIAGNHDFCFEKMRKVSEGILTAATYLHNSSTIIEGLKFYGSPFQPWFYNWAFNLPRRGDALKANWELIPDDTDILITHGPPWGILDTNYRGDHCGCELLETRVKQVKPKLHVFGHIHQGHGQTVIEDTRYVNPSVLDDRYRPVFQPIVVEL